MTLTDTKLTAFCQEYCRTVQDLPGVSSVEFIGSVANGNFVPGKSDIDVFVHGHKIPGDSKRQATALVRQLNTKYQLGLERAPCQHPTPFFIEGWLSRRLYHLSKGRQLYWLRAMAKMVAPSYGLVWRITEE